MQHSSKTVVLAFLLVCCRPMSISYSNPKELVQSEAFSQVVEVQSPKLLFISGQVALDRNGALIGTDLSAQFRHSLKNVEKALIANESDWKKVAQLRIYVVDLKPEHRFVIMMELDKVFGENPRPANTLVGVQSLARKDLRVEIEAIAAAY